MRSVDLNDRFDDPLLDLVHAVQFFIENFTRLHRVNRLEIIALPLHVQHDGKRSLRMPPFFRADLLRSCDSQVSPRPEPDIRRERPAGAGKEIRNALQACELHVIAFRVRVVVFLRFIERTALQEPCNHKLQKSVFRGQLGLSAGIHFPDFVDGKSLLRMRSGQPHADLIVPEPRKKGCKPAVHPQDIHRAAFSRSRLITESRSFIRAHENTADMMLQRGILIIQYQNRMRGIRKGRVAFKFRIGAYLWCNSAVL